ncbi:ParB/RepB/Spo0J family partition protein [Edwardsiella piscicida]|nr:ParB/RepB/Spo0J family partition protein [Edwardsiella piscicida]
MSTKRKTIGRTFTTPSLTPSVAVEGADSFSQVFTLASGKRARFTRVVIPYHEIETQTFVEQETNGREQAALTPASLQSITRTLVMQQFFPVIGIRRKEQIEILDGSRRRAAALLVERPLDAMVTEDEISVQDARQLAQDIQTAKEHNLREIGLRLQSLRNSGLTQKEIAKQEGLSEAKVTRALQAASVPSSLLAVFPVQSELSFPDYKVLLDIDNKLQLSSYTSEQFVALLQDELCEIQSKALTPDESKYLIMTLFRKHSHELTDSERTKPVVTPLWDFNDKNRYARKKQNGRVFSYEFNRLSTEVQSALDEAIQAVLAAHLARENS